MKRRLTVAVLTVGLLITVLLAFSATRNVVLEKDVQNDLIEKPMVSPAKLTYAQCDSMETAVFRKQVQLYRRAVLSRDTHRAATLEKALLPTLRQKRDYLERMIQHAREPEFADALTCIQEKLHGEDRQPYAVLMKEGLE